MHLQSSTASPLQRQAGPPHPHKAYMQYTARLFRPSVSEPTTFPCSRSACSPPSPALQHSALITTACQRQPRNREGSHASAEARQRALLPASAACRSQRRRYICCHNSAQHGTTTQLSKQPVNTTAAQPHSLPLPSSHLLQATQAVLVFAIYQVCTGMYNTIMLHPSSKAP
jgi:hypothetical protein